MTDILLTAAQMRALERTAIDSGAVTGLELMERAGAGAVAAILGEWPELAVTPGRAVVLCGPGNNGGDGFVVARLLAEQGWEVEVFLYGDAGTLPPDARTNCEIWKEMGEVRPLAFPHPTDTEIETFRGSLEASAAGRRTDLVVDALFGIGLSRPLGAMATVLRDTRLWGPAHGGEAGPFVVCLDIPSGICSDSGRILSTSGEGAVGGHLTLAFGYQKPGHFLGESPDHCGRIELVDIGIAATFVRETPGRRYDPERRRPADDSKILKLEIGRYPSAEFFAAVGRLDKAWGQSGQHKYDHGHALVLTGGFGRTGAARMAARAALRIGAGLVTVAAPGAAMMECATQLTAIMLRRCDDAEGLVALLEDDRLNALCLGPGLGTDDRAAGLVETALESGRACLLDADALTLIARDDTLRAKLHEACVLTPHAGEFARLFPDIADRLAAPAETGPAYSKVDATRAAAARAGCTILYKGPDTVIADPAGRAAINAALYDRAAPWLATAGAGDVLSGIIAGLLARGLSPFDAACSGAWAHVEAALDFGPGLIAEDLPDRLPAVLARLAAR